MSSNEFSLGYFEFELSLGNQCEDFQVHIGFRAVDPTLKYRAGCYVLPVLKVDLE